MLMSEWTHLPDGTFASPRPLLQWVGQHVCSADLYRSPVSTERCSVAHESQSRAHPDNRAQSSNTFRNCLSASGLLDLWSTAVAHELIRYEGSSRRVLW